MLPHGGLQPAGGAINLDLGGMQRGVEEFQPFGVGGKRAQAFGFGCGLSGNIDRAAHPLDDRADRLRGDQAFMLLGCWRSSSRAALFERVQVKVRLG